ncbi:unnamed protein product [Schistosoma margrebowiei]|uniref:Secreted protein n=1 Tax=Schistosoma margrebowiei TaxID=48269 RepID=A0A3P8GFA5_9TREM|nr:unnamed protein product [Schistosoma margrebowiei]
MLMRMWSIFAVTATSAFSACDEMLSGPAASPLLICLMAMLISSIVGGRTSIGRSLSVDSIFVGWVQCGWLIQKYLKVFYPPVSLFFNVGDYLAFLAFHWSFWFTVISRQFLCCVIQFSHVSFSCSIFRLYC